MEYQVLYINDNGTAKVRMTIDGKTLEQDFATDDLDANIKQGMAVFKSELGRNVPVDTSIGEDLIGQVTKVLSKDLPTIPPEDLEPEQPSEVE